MVQRGFIRSSPGLRWLVVTGLLAGLGPGAPTVAAPSPEKGLTTRPEATGTAVAQLPSRRGVGAGKPRKVCGRRLLDGPATRPHGAKVVRTTQDLPGLVDRAAPGTTFWLMPGVHTFGDDQYAQVGPKDG